ncbi:MAG TPA: hypothetical protein VIQ30_14205, partial [Pseudonocardia sp.]
MTDIEEPAAGPAEEPAAASPAAAAAQSSEPVSAAVDGAPGGTAGDGAATEVFYPATEDTESAPDATAASADRKDSGDDRATETFPAAGKLLGAGGLFTAATALGGRRRPSPRSRDTSDGDPSDKNTQGGNTQGGNTQGGDIQGGDIQGGGAQDGEPRHGDARDAAATSEHSDGPDASRYASTEVRLREFLGFASPHDADEGAEPGSGGPAPDPSGAETGGGRSFGGRKLALAAMALVVAASGAGLLVNRMQAVTVAPTGESDDTAATRSGQAHSAIENPTPEYVPPVAAAPGEPGRPTVSDSLEPPGEPSAPLPKVSGGPAL